GRRPGPLLMRPRRHGGGRLSAPGRGGRDGERASSSRRRSPWCGESSAWRSGLVAPAPTPFAQAEAKRSRASMPSKNGQKNGQKKQKKPNIILIVSDVFVYGDAGVYGGGEN